MSDSSAHSNNVTIVNRKLLLIDSRVQDTTTIINAANDDTYCLVFNYYQDTTDTLLSKIRFLNDNNRYIEDNFYYFEPKIKKCNGSIVLANLSEFTNNTDSSVNTDPTPSDNCVSCTEEEINNIQLVPSTLYAEHLSFTLNGPSTDIVTSNSSTNDISFNLTTAWPYYETKINKPVFFQRSIIKPINTDASPNPDISGSNMNTDASSTPDMPDSNANADIYPNRDISSLNVNTDASSNPDISSSNVNIDMTPSKYKQRGSVFINHLDEIYELAKQAQEVSPDTVCIHFEVIGVIQHANATKLGYKLFDNQPLYAEIDNVSTNDSQLNSWAAFSSFIQILKTKFNLTTLDLMACALYSNPDWKYIIDTLSVQQNITIRASYDDTGASSSGGNWILETNDINLTSVYFTPEIYNWKFLLTSSNQSYALQFDGVDDAINVGTPGWSYSTQIRQTFTVECWFKTSDTSNQKIYTVIVGRNYSGGTSSGAFFSLYMVQTGEIGFGITTDVNTSIYRNTTQTYKDMKWHHAAGSYNYSGGIMKLYIDGVNVATVNDPTKGILSSTTSTRFVIGSDDGGLPGNNYSNRQFRGYISDVRMWNVVRSDADISNNYQQRLIGNETGLVGYWKLNQGYGTGWGTYSIAVDSADNRTNGTLTSFANPSANWVVSDISFNPRITNFVLGPKNGAYNMTDSSFSFIDPSSNSLGAFSYSIDNSNATIADGASTTKIIYSNTGPITIPTLNTYEFPMLADLSNWQIDISFTVTGGGGTWRGMIGDMYNDISPSNRGWGIWVSSANSIHWSWLAVTYEPSFSVSLNTAYIITVIGTNTGTVTLILKNAATSAVISSSSTTLSNTQLGRGPVTIGGWRSTGPGGWGWNETFPGIISYVNVSVPTVNRVVTLLSGPSSVITASQTHYFDFVSSTKTANVTITGATPTLGAFAFTDILPANIGDPAFNITAPTSNSAGTFTYTSSNTAVATISANTFTSSNLLARYDSSVPSYYTLSGSNVTQWNDLTGNGYHLTSNGTGPTISTINSLPAFDFNSGKGLLRTAVPLSSVITVFMVIKYSTNIGTWGSFMHHGNRDFDWALERNSWYTAITPHNIQFQSNNINGPPELSATNGVNYILIGRISGNTREFWKYSDTEASGFASGSSVSIVTGNKSIYVGKSNNGESCNSIIGEILYYNTSISDANIKTNLKYLQNKWFNNITGNTVSILTIVGGGSSIITAYQAANAQYTDASVNTVLTVGLDATTLTRGTNFTTTASKTYDPASLTYSVIVTSSRGGTITYSSSDTNVATVDASGLVTIVKSSAATTTTITASQAATSLYEAATITSVLTVALGTNTWSNTFAITSPKTYGDTVTYTAPVATYSPAGAITYSTTTDVSNVATINESSGAITLVGNGTVTFRATQAATDKYASSTIDSSAVTVNRAITTITRTTDTSGTISKTYASGLMFSVAATSSRGTAVLYTSSDTSVATVNSSSGLVTVLKAGPTTITASQTETSQYAAGSASWALTVALITNTLIRGTNFTNATITRTYDPNSTTFNVSASSDINSITDVVFTSSDPNVASITRVNATTSQITINTAGSISITASQAQMTENQYAAATDISCALIINRRLATLFRNAPYSTSATIAKYYGTGSFYVSASSSSDGAVTYESDNSGVAQVNSTSGEVNLYGVGTAAITVRQADSSKYTTPTNIAWTLDISRGTTAITGIPTDLSYSVINAPFYLVPSTASGGTITYSLSDPSSNVATVDSSSGLVTLKKAGVATIVVSQAQSALYNAPSSVSCILSVSGAGNSLENVVINSETQSFSGVDLSGASLAGATMTGVSFDGASLAGASLAGANVSGASFDGASLVGASLAGANVSGASFDGASMAGASLAGANVAGASFAGTSLAGASLAGANISGASFAGASLSNADLSGADISGVNFSNANISGANISGLSFAPVQKLQLLKNTNNRQIDQVQIEDVTGDVVLSVVPQGSTLLQMPNIETAVFKVIVPNTSTSPTAPLINVPISQSNNADAFYLPISEGEYFKISNVKYYIVGTTIKNYRTNATVDVLIDNGKQYRMFVGSIAGVTLEANTLSSSTFIGPIARLISDTRPIYTTTRPTSNSGATIVYSSNNPSVATIDSSGEQITMISSGSVSFTASQVATLTHAGGSITSNTFTIYTTQIKISFNVAAFDSVLQMDVSGTMPGTTYQMPTTDATSVFYVKLDDFRDVFKFQTDSFDINDASMSDTRYYVFKNRWPSTIKLNPSHSMINVGESTGMMGSSGMFAQNKALLKHDYIRYLAYKLFRTIHGVDLFKNESDLLENLTYWGETIRNDIENKLDAISTTSSDATMPIDNSGNRFLTNELTANTNISRELMTQISGNNRERLLDISGTSDIQSIPLMDNDSFNIIITVFAAENQNNLTGSDSISSRTYNMKVVLKNDITGLNVPVIDSEMFPNAYPYSGNVAVITSDNSANYVAYSPPVAVPVSRYGFNGWYYKNTSAWVTVDPTVRNKIKWSVSPNTGLTKVSDLKYLRVNVKVYNKTSLPYITVYTASSKRAYVVTNSASITNNGKYTFYANFNAYTRLPAVIDHTNQELTVSSSGALTQGSFDNNETITRIALETDSAASYDAVEFTMSCIVVGETSGEKEHWFQGAIA